MRPMQILILGSQKLDNGDAQGALDCYADAFRGGLTDASVFYHVGRAFEKLNDGPRAYAAFREAIDRLTAGHSQETRAQFEAAAARHKQHWKAASAYDVNTLLPSERSDMKTVAGIRMDTYELVELSSRAKSLSRGCSGIGDYFSKAGDAADRGDYETAIALMEGAVNATAVMATKAKALGLAACALAASGSRSKARDYIDVALQIAPNDRDVLRYATMVRG